MSNLKKIVALVLAMALVMTMFAGAAIKTDLSKYVDGEAFTEAQKDALALVNAVGVIEGVAENEIGAASLTRAQLVKVLYVLCEGTKDGADKFAAKIFDDVAADNWAAGYIAWAYLKGIIKGVGDNKFAPDAKVTPIQAAAMLARLFDANACMNPDTFNQDAQLAAIKYGLTKGIVTPNFFALNETARGDMFIMIANALLYEYKAGHNLLIDVFGIEKIEGAILTESVKQFYKDGKNAKNAYSVFTFTVIEKGDVSNVKAASAILCVEDDIDNVQDDLGCKYIIYVSKNASYNGFRKLFAAYEMDDNYYDVLEGTVDDGKLKFNGKEQNVWFDKNAIIYVDGAEVKTADVAGEFQKWYNKQNKASYKLIDNDGDGYIEYAFINRFVLGSVAGEWITGNVTYYSNKDCYGIDGTVYGWGQYWVKNADGSYTLKDAKADCYGLLGQAKQAISDVKYDFYVADGYIYDVRISESTQFFGNYGIVLDNSYRSTYKNMFYYTFLNEQNETVSAYVEKVNQTFESVFNSVETLDENTLVYFTGWNEAGDVCSVYTADYEMSNYTYEYNTLNNATIPYDVASDITVGYNIVDKFDLSKENVADIVVIFDTLFPMYGDYVWGDFDLCNYAYDFKTIADMFFDGKYSAAYDAMRCAFGFAGFGIKKTASVKVGGTVDGVVNEFQIYRANGFWSYRTYFTVNDFDGMWISIGDKKIPLEFRNGKWVALVADGWDPGIEIGDSIFDDVELAVYYAAKEVLAANGGKFVVTMDAGDIWAAGKKVFKEFGSKTSKQGFLNIDKGVVFLYGAISASEDTMIWRAYKAADITKDFGMGTEGDDWGRFDSVNTIRMMSRKYLGDQIISTSLKGVTYVKAMAVTVAGNMVLPNGWVKNEDAEVVLFAGATGNYSANGWEITVYGEDLKAKNVWCNVGLGGLEKGDLLLIYTDENGVVNNIYRLAQDIEGAIAFVNNNGDLGTGIAKGVKGFIKAEGVLYDEIEGFGGLKNYIEYTYKAEGALYVVDGAVKTAFDAKWAGKTAEVFTYNGLVVVFVK